MRRAGLLLCVWAAVASAQSQPGGFDQAFDGEERSWREIESQLPAYPRAENLFQFDPGGTTANRYLIDTASISVSPDGVVRYSMVIRSAEGAENVSFEGIRCDTRERRLYAFGRRDGSWSRARNSRWERIEANVAQSRHQLTLYKDFFCPEGRIVANREEILDGLQRGMNRQLQDLYRGGNGGGD
jgi:hypothetical protein